MKKLGFIGTGNMGGALVLAAAKSNSENEILLSDKIREKADALAEKTGGKVVDNITVAEKADYIFLGVNTNNRGIALGNCTCFVQSNNLSFSCLLK